MMKPKLDRSKYDRILDDEDDAGDTDIDEREALLLASVGRSSDGFTTLSPHPRQRRRVSPNMNRTSHTPRVNEAGDYVDEEPMNEFASGPPYDGIEEVDEQDGQFDPSEPSARDMETLRRIPDKLPWTAYLVAIVELCERFSYYGLSGPFQNYISNNYKDGGNPGALGLGQVTASQLTNFFQFWCYVTPIIGAIIADQYLGKYKTILYFAFIYLFGLVILFTTSLPSSIEHGAAYGGLVTAMLVIGLGTGGIKSNVSPLIAEQITETRPRVRIEKSGERVIVDPALTVQRVYMIFYMCINVGSLSAIATTNMELHIGFWSAYLLALCMFAVGLGVLVAGKKKYVVKPPKGSVIFHAFQAMWMGLRKTHGLEGLKPSNREKLGQSKVPWDDLFIDELRRALTACKVFLFFPVYWAVYGQMTNNFVSQAGTMELHGIPNDIMQNIDPITIILFIPICDRLFYPFLRKMGIQFKPITRITWGFLLGSLAMAYAAILQNMIYKAGPCYDHPLKCPEAKINNPITGETTILHNQVHVAIQTPAYFLIAMSEIFASITGLEYAYTKAPTNMKAFVMSMFLLTNAFGALFGLALASTAKDPKLTWMYTGLAVSAFIAGVIFWLLYSHLNRSEDAMNLISNGDGEHNGQEEDKTGLDAMFQSRPKSYRMSELPAKTVADQIVHRSNSERQGVVIAPPPAVPTEGEMTEVTHR